MITFDTSETDDTKIKVVGVGGGGCNAINNMINRGLRGVELIAVNTDMQALKANRAEKILQIGQEITGGKGAGSIPEVGRKAAEESIDELRDALKDSDMIFITCGMGGGTGTGASPVIAKIARDMGALVVGIVTLPFAWEGPDRAKFAKDGIAELREYIDALIVIPNDKLIDSNDRSITFIEAYSEVDNVLYRATSGIAEIIVNHGYVNVDFADVKTVMQNQGDTLMGVGVATGENRAIEATENALNSPFLDGISIKGAQRALINIVGGKNLGMFETDDVLKKFREYSGEKVNIIYGVMIDEEMEDELKVTIVATGFQNQVTSQLENEKKEEAEFETDLTANKGVSFQDLLERSDNKNTAVQETVFAGVTSGVRIQKPKGNDGLKLYDQPTFTRRGIKYSVTNKGDAKIISTAEQVSSRYENIHKERTEEEVKKEINEIAMENSRTNKPAFLRKIMD